MRALIVGNRGDSDPGVIGMRLDQLGWNLEICHREYSSEWRSLENVDLLLLLGSDWSVNDQRLVKEISAEASMFRAAQRSGIPTLAICYGAQLASTALGGQVERSRFPEIGWHRISRSVVPKVLSHEWFQWHYDTFAVPAGCTLAAENDAGSQAFLGYRLLATQFHPEATLDIVTRWCDSVERSEVDMSVINLQDILASSRDAVSVSKPCAVELVDWFLEFSNSKTEVHVTADSENSAAQPRVSHPEVE
jgi:GMP synthase-like glutamine amidotransferase